MDRCVQFTKGGGEEFHKDLDSEMRRDWVGLIRWGKEGVRGNTVDSEGRMGRV